ncbi:hypothetical protein VNO77_39111 [Canavalia gladiata]|uniref:Uncharacterized protein n=1 Tax=Canavalia gladiata TaxID=3824 RepID=A0AAN9KC37_CANGL
MFIDFGSMIFRVKSLSWSLHTLPRSKIFFDSFTLARSTRHSVVIGAYVKEGAHRHDCMFSSSNQIAIQILALVNEEGVLETPHATLATVLDVAPCIAYERRNIINVNFVACNLLHVEWYVTGETMTTKIQTYSNHLEAMSLTSYESGDRRSHMVIQTPI